MKKKLLVACLLLVAVATAAGGSYYAWLVTPPPLPQTADEAIEVIGSPRYTRLPEHRKTEYVAQARRLLESLPDDQRQALIERTRADDTTREAMGQVRREIMTARAKEFAAASPTDRQRMLDEDINRMEQMRAMRGMIGGLLPRPGGSPPSGAASSGGGPGGAGGSGPDEAQRKQFQSQMGAEIREAIQQGNPQTGAMIRDYFRAMRARRVERGLPDPP